ncbi:MAG: hypothetical protein ACK4P3_01960 [Fimbriimonadaceae bacterium]
MKPTTTNLTIFVFASLFWLASSQCLSQSGGSSGGGVIVRELPQHLHPIAHDAENLLYEQARVDDAIAFLLGNAEYLNHPASRGRNMLSLAYCIKGQWDAAAEVLDMGGMFEAKFTPMVYAFSGQIERARNEYEVRNNFDSSPQYPQSPYLAQGDSVRALQANTAFVYAMSANDRSQRWLRRHFLRLAYDLAPEAPLIALRYVSYAEPDIRKGLAILATLEFPTNSRLQRNVATEKQLLERQLKEAERGDRPFILEYRTKTP